jgi:hypothetical protein
VAIAAIAPNAMRLLIVEFSFDDPSPRGKAGIGKAAVVLLPSGASYVNAEAVLPSRRF